MVRMVSGRSWKGSFYRPIAASKWDIFAGMDGPVCVMSHSDCRSPLSASGAFPATCPA